MEYSETTNLYYETLPFSSAAVTAPIATAVASGAAISPAIPSGLAAATAASVQSDQVVVDRLVGVAQHLDELVGASAVPLGEEGVSDSRGTTATCSANTMNVILNLFGEIIVDDKLDVLDI